jgi:hypothetical protein
MKATVKGKTFWTAAEGFPWEITAAADSPPDFRGRGKDTSLGSELPHDGQLHPTRLHFRGYQTLGSAPRFKYDLELSDGEIAHFEEAVSALKTAHAHAVLRETAIELPAGRVVWLRTAVSDEPPLWHTNDGSSTTLEQSDGTAPGDAVLKVVQQGTPVVLHLKRAEPRTQWLALPQDGKWTVLVRMPATTTRVQLALAVVVPLEQAMLDAVIQAEIQPAAAARDQ